MATLPPLHRTLERQLRRLGLDREVAPGAAPWAQLLERVSAVYQGADDDRYTLERSIEISSTEMRALHDELSARALQDALTGMPNRLALLEHVGLALAASRRHAESVTVLFIDLDGFKLINDRLGHAAGDELLIRAAERIRRAVRTEDVVARLGGDEFVVLTRSAADPVAATRVGQRVVEALEAPFRLQGLDTFVSGSVGVAMTAGGTETPERLLHQADLAMYRAKAQGRGLVVLFNADMQAHAEQHAELESAVLQAVELDQLVLHYQPLVRLGDGTVEGYEALVRWDRPGHGLIGPDQFIPVAELGRFVSVIGRWVLAEACREAAGWPDATTSVYVNLCAQELGHDSIVASVTDALQRSGLAPARLTIELTETTMLDDEQVVATNLQRLQRLGIRVAIDDFGTGYSSLSHLRALPATILKIDRSFTRDIDDAAPASAIVAAIVTMGHALGLTIVAEGVERPAQLELLRALGCDIAQGYLLAPPRPAAELAHHDPVGPQPV